MAWKVAGNTHHSFKERWAFFNFLETFNANKKIKIKNAAKVKGETWKDCQKAQRSLDEVYIQRVQEFLALLKQVIKKV